MKSLFRKKILTIATVAMAASLGLTACYVDTTEMRMETAKRIAMPSFLLERQISADPFILTVNERIHKRGGDAVVYIEGDGKAWATRRQPSLDPTPTNPVALHLASRDNSVNVVYMARPCQYTKMTVKAPCNRKYWTSDRFSSEVVTSMAMALDNIKKTYDIQKFDLVGFSGGGAIAPLLAAGRDDIRSIRTVAGNLDHERVMDNHQVSRLTNSLNARDVAESIGHIPQHHFIGEWDEVVTRDVYDSYRAASGTTSCLRVSMVKEVTHEKGWVNKWPEMLKAPLDCQSDE